MLRHERYVENRIAWLQSRRDEAIRDVVASWAARDPELFDFASQAFDASTPALQGLERYRSRQDRHLAGSVVDDTEHSLELFREIDRLKAPGQ